MDTQATGVAADNGSLIAAYDKAQANGSLAVGGYEAFAKPAGVPLVGRSDWAVVLDDDDGGTALKIAGKFAVMHDSTATVADEGQGGGLRAPRFEGGEHTMIGNSILLRFTPNDPGTVAAQVPLAVQPGLSLTYGQILALGGDFYGVPNRPIADGDTPDERKRRFLAAYDTLAKGSVAEMNTILDIMRREIDAVNAALAQGQPASTVYDRLGDDLNKAWNKATGGGGPLTDLYPLGRYLKLAEKNWDHFGDSAILAYQAAHAAALGQAVIASAFANTEQACTGLVAAYAMNAFADHYLSDLFSAGHIRDPRRELFKSAWNAGTEITSNLCAKFMHDEDSRFGLRVSNARNEIWRAYGDKRYFDTVNLENKAMVDNAVQASANEVFDAFVSGRQPINPGSYQALRFVPNLHEARDYKANVRGNFAPMFVLDDGWIGSRRSTNNLDSRNYEWIWDTPSFVTHHYRYYEPRNPAGFIAPPTAAPQIDRNGWQSTQPIPPNWVNGNQVRYFVSFESSTFESDIGPGSAYVTLQGAFQPTLTHIPTGPGGVVARRIYRQFINQPITYAGRIDDNLKTTFVDGPSPVHPDYVCALMTGSGHFLTAVNNGGIGAGENVPIRTSERRVLTWERFRVIDAGRPGDQISLQTSGGRYVTAVNNGGMTGPDKPAQPIQTNRTRQGRTETFFFEFQPDGTFAIRTADGYYLTAVNGGGWGNDDRDGRFPIHTNATEFKGWETFTLVRGAPPQLAALLTDQSTGAKK